MALEQQGKGGDAVKLYVRAARSGNGKAAKRLGQIYDKGIAGISRDYAESSSGTTPPACWAKRFRWRERALQQRLKAGR